MAWLLVGIVLALLIAFVVLVTMACLKIGSDCDDETYGDEQYIAQPRTMYDPLGD